jgi:uncharacterized Zn-binding protein involved in type VI secretion
MFDLIGSICVGDKTSCGATVATGTPSTTVNGRAIARVGDRIGCRHNCQIITGNPIVDGAPMALHGSLTLRQCICLSSNNSFHGDAQGAEAAAAIPAAADVGIAHMPETAHALNEDHWVEFQLVNAANEPIASQAYVLTDPAGATFPGSLDQNGCARVSPVKAGLCRVEFPELDYTMTVTS